MKRPIISILIILAILSALLSGCSSSVKANTDPGKVINTGVDKEFTIALGSNITTGYSWLPEFDASILSLSETEYRAKDTTGKQIVGAGGTQYFHFKALKSGDTQVKFTYYRPWETPTAQDETETFKINVR